jgi:hypothetical protein
LAQTLKKPRSVPQEVAEVASVVDVVALVATEAEIAGVSVATETAHAEASVTEMVAAALVVEEADSAVDVVASAATVVATAVLLVRDPHPLTRSLER